MAKYTTDDIIEQFTTTHKDTYDYSLVEYVHSQTKVKIICRKHGAFEQLPGMHRKGQGCAKCMYDDKRRNQSDVVERFIEIHGNVYDYSLVVYKNIDTKVSIICSEHSIFEQSPYHHIQGNGCPKCVGKYKSQHEVLKLFKDAHGDRYDYSKVSFNRVNDKVQIICREHGSFLQTPIGHYSGKGCIKCSGTHVRVTEDILSDFVETHGNRYNYSLVDYSNSKSRVKIICHEHGIFEQYPRLHANGSGCPQCGGTYQYSTTEIIEQFIEMHGDTYNYSRVVYQGAHETVDIICKTHGLFSQGARSHKKGSGCPKCAVTIGHTKNSYLEYCNKFDGLTHLYLIKCRGNDESFYKVGIARRGVFNRFDSKGKMPYSFELISQIKGTADFIWDLESSIHKLLGQHSYTPELSFSGQSECFSQISKDVLLLIDSFSTSTS